MPLQATSGAASYDAFGGGVPFEPIYIEQVFQNWLYTGNTTTTGTQTITNGIDLAGKGGLVWVKNRSDANWNVLADTVTGITKQLYSNSTSAQTSNSGYITSANANGFGVGASGDVNFLNNRYASWTFREQPKFFDVVTYTGNGSTFRTIAHNLGSVPGCMLVKRTDVASDWQVYHRSIANTTYLVLNDTAAVAGFNNTRWASTTPNSTSFFVGNSTTVNANGGTYVAYLFAHNAGGFGLTGTDNVISCGSFTGNGVNVNLGWEPQWVLVKNASGFDNWQIQDSMRGMTVDRNDQFPNKRLYANTSGAEADYGAVSLTSTGFITGGVGSTDTGIYIAIRRGPMKVPTTGTSVFSPNTTSGSAGTNITTDFPVDLQITRNGARSATTSNIAVDRLRGVSTTTTDGGAFLGTTSTNGESTAVAFTRNWGSTGFQVTTQNANVAQIYWNFRRAPGFFDEVCYTGTGVARTIEHNLAAVPELIIVKCRSTAVEWPVYAAALGNTNALFLNATDASSVQNYWNNTTPTSSVFSVRTPTGVNGSGQTYVSYLFASCPGVSKVFNFTGNGSSQTINCGFTGGARFVMIKRTDSTGDWYVWDTARGIVANNDPHLSLNTTAAEVTSNDTIDTDSTGFVVNQVSATNVNVNGASYIGLAIA